jgi:hypothetical protein
MAKVMVYIVHDRAVDGAIQGILNELEIDHYSRFRDALEGARRGERGALAARPHSVTIAVVEESARRKLLGRLKALQVDSSSAGIRAFVVSVVETL